MKGMIKPPLVLFFTAVIAAVLLAFVYQKTEPEIERRAKEQLLSNLEEVFPEKDVTFKPVIKDTVWRVLKGDKVVGLIFINGKRGYASVIKTVVSIDTNLRVIKVLIPKEGLSETPGLGMKVTEPWFQKQFQGKSEKDILLKKDGGSLDAVTAATISSRAAVGAVREGIEKYKNCLKTETPPGTSWYKNHLKEMFPADSIVPVREGCLWKAYKGKKVIGEIYLSYGSGYGGKIGVLVGEKNGVIKSMYIQSPMEGLKESEGWGTKIREPEYIKKYIGKKIEDVKSIDCITGATISVNGLKEAIIKGYESTGRNK